MRLYEIATEFRGLMSRILDEEDGEVTPDLEAELNALEGQLETKVDAVAKVRAELLAEADLLRMEERRLANRRKALEKNASRLVDYLGDCLRVLGTRKVKTLTHTISLQKNPPKVALDVEPAAVPDNFVEWKPHVRIDEIKAALKAGKELPFAHLEQGESVRIR